MKIFGYPTNTDEYQTRPSVYGIYQNMQGEITLEQVESRYFLPGGGIETGESNKEALQREFREELGAEITFTRCRPPKEPTHQLVWKRMPELLDSNLPEAQKYALKKWFTP